MKRLEFLFVSILFFVGCIALYLHVLVSGEDTVTKLRKVRRETPLLSTVKITMQIENISHPLATLATLATLVNKPLANPEEKVDTICVAIPTYNRIGYVQLTSSALKGTFPSLNTWIFDDKSTEYSEQDLIGWYGTEHVWQSKKRLKADAMARHILEWFLSTKYDVLVLLDSDLLVAPDWHDDLQKGLHKSIGLLSLYRSGAPKHKSVSCGDILCTMPSMGNAGTVWRRDLAKRMLVEMPNRDGGFDWGWSEWCTKNKVQMEALKNSAVLHIGMYGSWSHESTAEKSVGFPMKELSVDVRQRAEHFLKGAKPTPQKSDILWVIPAFKRAWSLDLVLQSLASQTNILVSKDADSADIESVLKKYAVEAIEHPWSCSRHPNQFPAKDDTLNENYKGDTYGNPRSPWATCLKHHWWWMMKQAWARKPERVCVLEDDTVIHPQAFEWLDKNKEGNVKLTPEEIAVPWCMSAKEWQAIVPKTFCEHDDYNWDQTIAWMKEHGHGPNEAVVPSVSLSMHVGDCGGWDAGGRDKKCTPEQIVKIRANVEHWLRKPVAINTIKKKWLTAHSKPNGGWGHPKDWAHCLGVASSQGLNNKKVFMWEEVSDNRSSCSSKCHDRNLCVSSEWRTPYSCMLYSYPITPLKEMNSLLYDDALCPILSSGAKCDCPMTTSLRKYIPMFKREKACSLLDGKKVLFTGDSLVRDVWTSMGLWLSKSEDMNTTETHAQCMANHWKMLKWSGIEDILKSKGIYSWSSDHTMFKVCDGRVTLYHTGEKKFKTVRTMTNKIEKLGIDIWIVGVGIHEMVTEDNNVENVEEMSQWLSEQKTPDKIIYMGTHRRIESRIESRAPQIYKKYAYKEQGNGKIKKWNKIMSKNHHGFHSIDPYFITENLNDNYRDTEDGMHFGHWVNMMKGQLVLQKINSMKYAVVIPSVKRNNDEYLRKTLDSLEKAKPADVSVLLVNANQPPEEHTYLIEWCSSHKNYKCIEPPKVSESLISDVISNDKRGDTAQYLRWRTMEAKHAMFGMSEFLKTGADYMVWLQDDVTVDEDLFSSLPNEEVVCLRSDGYCGMVAYMFKKSFVQKLIQRLEKNFKNMPIDWIVDQTHGKDAIRIPKAHHIGKKSSSKIPIKYIKLKIGVVLPYHGRHELLEIMGMQSHPEDLVLVQDTGQEFQGFKNVVHTIKHVSHKPIGKSIMEGYDWMYNNGYDILCNLDSDVLVKDNWLKESIRLLEQYPNDIVSAFNEANHLKHCVVKEFDDHYLKNCGGGIHYCFTRELYKTFVQPILANVEMKGDLNFWDAAIVEHIQAGGKYIIATKPSRIQHIGYTGFKENYESLSSRNKLWQVAPDYVLSDEEITLIGDIPELSVLIPKQTADIQTIQTSDLFAAIDYNAPENKGPWKQGWDYDYDGRFKDGLTVHVVPHSHNDPGWIKTYHTYYSTQTKHILDTIVASLTEDPRRTFIWAEISYFSLWWDDASPQQKEQAKQLVAEKRLDFVTGGWVMNDEASVTARATRWHLQEGREWLQKTFGITPQYSWAIDPFGHSAGQAQVLKELGYKGMLIQRVHYAVKKQLAEKQQLEFQWQTPVGDIFTHMMPFYSYDGPHTCGPDPSVCCQFDFARINGGYSGCPWHKPSVPITDSNVAERSKLWLDQVYKKAMLYRGKNVLIPVGDDFRYQTMDEAHKQFTNYQKMFDWIGVHLPSVKVSFSTLTRYFDAVSNTKVPRLEGSFFPYSDRVQDYWTGYFNSRIFYKGYDRLLESLVAAVESKCPVVDIHLQKRALGIFQHHDGITGTAKSHVVQDYYQTMQKAVTELKSKLKTCLDIAAGQLVNPLSVDTPTMKANEIRPYQEDTCVPATDLQLDNITVDEHGRLIQINDTPVHESLVWRSNNPGQGVAGAYLMSVTSKEDILNPIKHTTCIAKRYKQVETTFDMLKRRIRVYNDGTIEFIYDVDIHARNNGELWAMYKPEWSAERLCSDVHGLTWECHVERKDAPLQAKFWPMPTMAWLASSSERLTFTGAQPTGVGFHEGAMVLMLDRRGDQDDWRGLGQGITDSRPVEMRFGVLMETEILKERASEKSLSVRNWMLNPAIEIV
jgi:glycosyltransferase involved in cell wall biosynthesis